MKKYKLKDKLKHTLGLKSNIRKHRERKIKKKKLNEINIFYNRDDNSRATAGKSVKLKIKLQRRNLLTRGEGGSSEQEQCWIIQFVNASFIIPNLHNFFNTGNIDLNICQFQNNYICRLLHEDENKEIVFYLYASYWKSKYYFGFVITLLCCMTKWRSLNMSKYFGYTF